MFQLLRKWQRRSQELPEDIIDYKHQCEQLVNKYETLLDQISQYMQTEERILGKEQAEVVIPTAPRHGHLRTVDNQRRAAAHYGRVR
jgi:hypothetical protein